MRRSNQYLTVTVAVVMGVLIVMSILIRPFVSVTRTPQLVGPPDEYVWRLIRDDAPLESIKEAVEDTGKHVDQIVWMKGSLLSVAVDKQRPELAEWLLQNGANPDGVVPGTDPMSYAIENNDLQMVKLLLKYNADPDLDLGGGLTLYFIAETKGNDEIIRELQRASESKNEKER